MNVRKQKFTKKEKYIHAAKVLALGSVLLPVYAGLLAAGAGLKILFTVLGVELADPDPPTSGTRNR